MGEDKNVPDTGRRGGAAEVYGTMGRSASTETAFLLCRYECRNLGTGWGRDTSWARSAFYGRCKHGERWWDRVEPDPGILAAAGRKQRFQVG